MLPDGVRLARLDELRGPKASRDEAWARVQSASIFPGFRMLPSSDKRFSVFAEANVDAPDIWSVFLSLAEALLGASSSLLIGKLEEDLASVGPFPTHSLLKLLRPYRYQLTNDGHIQVGLIDERLDSVVEILITPTKHLEIWTSDDAALRAVFSHHLVEQVDELQFLDEFPRITETIGLKERVALDATELVELLIAGPAQPRH